MKIEKIYDRKIVMEDWEEVCPECGGTGCGWYMSFKCTNKYCVLCEHNEIPGCKYCNNGKVTWIDKIMKKI